MAKRSEKLADGATCSIRGALEHVGQSLLRRSKPIRQLRCSHSSISVPLNFFLVPRVLLRNSRDERIDDDCGDGRQLVPSLKVRKQRRMQSDQSMRITIPVAHKVHPPPDKCNALIGGGRVGVRSLENETELVVRLVAGVIEEVQVDELPGHQVSSHSGGQDDRKLLRRPAVDMDRPPTVQIDPFRI